VTAASHRRAARVPLPSAAQPARNVHSAGGDDRRHAVQRARAANQASERDVVTSVQLPADLKVSLSAPIIDLGALAGALEAADTLEAVLTLDQQLDIIEQHMRDNGLYTADQLREVNELRMRARWKLGRLLGAVGRGTGPGRGRKIRQVVGSFWAALKELGLDAKTAERAQRIATLPKDELEKALTAAHKDVFPASYRYLLDRARPYWYQASRKQKHARIQAAAVVDAVEALGPFPVIYADPPWKFEIYSDKGLERTADQHYPTLTDEEIAGFSINGKKVPELAHRDAALFLWCTSSNLKRALCVMERWGFEFKTSAVWVKDKAGLGLVFRNRHEILLYGTCGNMPGPQYQPDSVFDYPRGQHSAKPPEIRGEIARMYPDFTASTRLELFSRVVVPGWTAHGLEAYSSE
jgi:N6-adenosine-specific RNA methylase IME4